MGSVGTTNESIRIKNEFIQYGLNSKLKGVRRDAEAGTGNYRYKDASPVSDEQALNIKYPKFVERNGKTLAYGLIGQQKVFYAANSSDSTIQQLKANVQARKTKELEEERKAFEEKPDIKPTSTYDRWKKRHDANFRAWFGEDRLK